MTLLTVLLYTELSHHLRERRTTLSYLEDILSEYTRMRDNGVEAKNVLQALRPHIEKLDKARRDELVGRIRAWESQAAPAALSPDKTDTQPRKHAVIKPIAKTASPASSPIEPKEVSMGDNDKSVDWITCPNCGKPNRPSGVFCYACGQLLEPIKGSNATKQLADPNSLPGSEYFGVESVLALRVRGTTEVFEVQPQKADHEIIIGRSTDGSAIMPDIDLNSKQAADLGVSRMHVAVHYDGGQNAILLSDLGSVNGTYINSQRVVPKEIRVLRHGDELRLGRLVLLVSFRHNKK